MKEAGQGSLYTDSDGISRLVNYIYTGITQIVLHTVRILTDVPEDCPDELTCLDDKPTCDIGEDDCDKLQEA